MVVGCINIIKDTYVYMSHFSNANMLYRMLLFAAAFQNGCCSQMALQFLSFAVVCFNHHHHHHHHHHYHHHHPLLVVVVGCIYIIKAIYVYMSRFRNANMPYRMLLFAAAFQNGCRSRMALQFLSFIVECLKGSLKLHRTLYLLLR